jgi:uncharacterized surface protein with fasciclin (FAS1) repeats
LVSFLNTSMFSSPFFTLLLSAAAVPPAYAQDTSYLTGLVTALNSLGLTGLAGAAAKVNGTEAGAALLSKLSSGNFTVFAPNNNAFDAVPRSAANNDSLLTSILSYHILPGNYSGISNNSPNHTVARTLLNETSGLVNLEGGLNQVLVWTTLDSRPTILNQGNGTNVTVSNSTNYQNLVINEINAVLIPPPPITVLVNETALNLSSFTELVASIPSMNNDSDTSFADDLENTIEGFTLFAPNNEALNAAQSAIQSIASNTSAVSIVLRNHLINGSTIYSPLITGTNATNATSAAGEPVSFMTNTTGTYVTVGASGSNSTAMARIVKSDVLARNGVVHVIDRLLAVMDNNEDAATSAAASASSVAAGFSTMATQTAPIGAPTGSATADGGNDASGGALKAHSTTGPLSVLVAALIALVM